MLSQTTEYALRAMTHLAAAGTDAASTAEVVAAHTKIPPGYVAKVLRDLVDAGLLTSQRGRGGGFTLARAPERITMLDVVNAVDPIRRIERCPLGNPAHVALCPLHRRLDQAIALIEQELRRTTLSDILATVRSEASCRALAAASPPAPWAWPTLEGRPCAEG